MLLSSNQGVIYAIVTDEFIEAQTCCDLPKVTELVSDRGVARPPDPW